MKKTLAAVAVLGAFAGTALAADVTLYGVVDLGLQYNHSNPAKGASTSTVTMENGQSAGSRWGLKGVEDLGAFKVGFILEDGFSSDTGAEKDQMFDRESSLFIEGAFGKLAVGRIGSINQGTSSWGQYGVTSPFGT
ncbi:MAG: porin, partial [Duodenibacillus sp.]|nr:porin [Duodenibacillus sp.]